MIAVFGFLGMAVVFAAISIFSVSDSTSATAGFSGFIAGAAFVVGVTRWASLRTKRFIEGFMNNGEYPPPLPKQVSRPMGQVVSLDEHRNSKKPN